MKLNLFYLCAQELHQQQEINILDKVGNQHSTWMLNNICKHCCRTKEDGSIKCTSAKKSYDGALGRVNLVKNVFIIKR